MKKHRHPVRVIVRAIILVCVSQFASAQSLDLDIYPSDERPQDRRTEDLKDLNGYFPFEVPTTKHEWSERSEKVRRRILVACGLWPMPPRPKVEATIHGRIEKDDYSVEKVYFESAPGLFVTGNLYRPKGKQAPSPVVLSPHGHWANGRFYDAGLKTIQQQRRTGAEWDMVGGRYPLQARCVQLARMGCVVFHYDMLGYADSRPITYERAHRHKDARPGLESPDKWGLFTAQSEMRLQNVFGLQTLNSLRAVDFVTSLPDVDPKRIGVTGASGGGTQTMILAAVDPRITVSFPAVMVSTAMQGGCTCENACCLRVGTGNVEFAALFAPKPQGINPANDWTVELATKGLPELKELYGLLDAKDKLVAYPELTYFPHNYNHVSRCKMYDWMNKHLKLGIQETILEREYQPLTTDEMTVWNDDHPAPANDVGAEIALLKTLAEQSDQQIAGLDKAAVIAAYETITATSWDDIGIVERENISKAESGDFYVFKDKLTEDDTEVPAIFLYPKNWNEQVVVWVSDEGKSNLLDPKGDLNLDAEALLDEGFAIAAPDLFQQGEYVDDPIEETRKVGNDRDFAGYTFGYNPTLIAHRVRDILTVLKFIDQNGDRPPEKLIVLAKEQSAPFAALAAALAKDSVDSVVIEDAGFRFSKLKSWRDPNFLPGAVKYGDLDGILNLCENAKVATKEDTVADLILSDE